MLFFVENGYQGNSDFIIFWLVVEPTHLKNMLVKLEIFPEIGVKIKKMKPPPSILSPLQSLSPSTFW